MLLSQLLAGQATSARTRPVIILSLPCGAQKKNHIKRLSNALIVGVLGFVLQIWSASADLIATNEPGDDVPAHVAKSEQRHEPAQLVSHFLCTVFVVHVVAN